MSKSMNFPSPNAQGKKVDSKPKSKIEIKKEDIQVSYDTLSTMKFLKIKTKHPDQLKQQILQDHEDAKKYETLLIDFRERGQKIHELSQDIKKWEENMKLLSRNINDDLKQAKKDRQIVKRLEEWKNKVDKIGWDDADVPTNIFQKILEEKN